MVKIGGVVLDKKPELQTEKWTIAYYNIDIVDKTIGASLSISQPKDGRVNFFPSGPTLESDRLMRQRSRS